MVHATLTGISTVYDAQGRRIGAPLGTDTSAAAVFDVPLVTGTTLYVRLGDWPVQGAVGVLAVFCAYEGVRSLRRRTPVEPVGAAAPAGRL
jgi:apolipoprotein N-acyltransferase